MTPSANLQSRLAKVKLLVLDVDGVLTDGRMIYGNYGDELKCFYAHDGFGIVTLLKMGIPTVILSSKKSKINERRARDLKIAKVYQNAKDKLAVLGKILKKFKASPHEVCFVGDDWVDIPVLEKVGCAVGVPNAIEEVKERAHYVTERRGGHGAVREVTDLILKAQGKWAQASAGYFKP
ncbi:MAG: HAD-IIIA family hydrolase [Candidatus Omnitrophica bacterium]|nr:HAD-IIIA family hydrolase [Candidatus Omnitrophota bacterium]